MVDTVADCYAALGVVHELWPFLPSEFDDYIATPKDNAYQSIHTAVRGPGGKAVEVQIRTREMHAQAEHGVAAPDGQHAVHPVEERARHRELRLDVRALVGVPERAHDRGRVPGDADVGTGSLASSV